MGRAPSATNGTRMFTYYPTAAWQATTFLCPQCGWSGQSDSMDMGVYNELMDLSCAGCDKTLAIVGYPTSAQVRAAAAAGEEEAIEQLKRIEWSERFNARRLNSELQSPEQLPDRHNEELVFRATEERREIQGSKEICFVIRCEGEVIWYEIAGYESWWRLAQMKQIFRNKYGSRMKCFEVEAYSYTYGDDISSPAKLQRELNQI